MMDSSGCVLAPQLVTEHLVIVVCWSWFSRCRDRYLVSGKSLAKVCKCTAVQKIPFQFPFMRRIAMFLKN
jgi:hypothetical protein